MRFLTRIFLVLTVAFAATTVAAQPAPATQTLPSAVSSPAADARAAREVREEFHRLVYEHPRELAMILALDPGLLSNEAFLAGYPDLARFVAQHPEIARSPHVAMSEFPVPGRKQESTISSILDPFFVFAGFGLFLFAFAWLVRTLIEQKRWRRLSQIQSDVHTKILDRFGTSDELLQYMKTPAGTKFLESAPIPVRAEEPVQNAPMTRILWSIQFGVIVSAGALGMIAVSRQFEKEPAQGLFAMGVIALSVGVGFIVSAFVSLLLSRRLGLWQPPAPPNPIDEAGLMR
jgi:hypothetical protein